MTRPEPAGVGTADEPSICVGGRLITRSDVIERLGHAGEHLGNAIAGYRDDNNKRAAKGLFEAATAMLDAKALLEQQPAAITASRRQAKEEDAKIAELRITGDPKCEHAVRLAASGIATAIRESSK